MRYRMLENLLYSHGWDGDEDCEGDMNFTRGDAGFWVQWYDDEDLDDGWICDDEENECYISHILRLVFTPQRMTIIWDDGDSWDYYY